MLRVVADYEFYDRVGEGQESTVSEYAAHYIVTSITPTSHDYEYDFKFYCIRVCIIIIMVLEYRYINYTKFCTLIQYTLTIDFKGNGTTHFEC